MLNAGRIALGSVSWIDEKALPNVGFWVVVGAAVSWPRRVIMGLVGTSNPEPPLKIPNVEGFSLTREYRALLSCTVDTSAEKTGQKRGYQISNTIVDPGYTPPFDKSKIHTSLRSIAPIPDDTAYYAGESSSLSGITAGGLHPSSSLVVPSGYEVVASALIKFRAGEHTDNIGVEEAKSPVHVPWVWCEYALVSSKSALRLLGQGSSFPSHAWYVNGTQVARRLQGPIAVSDSDPAISTGERVVKGHPATGAKTDRSKGDISGGGHQWTIGKGDFVDVEIPAALVQAAKR
jgi:hypothetical protein